MATLLPAVLFYALGHSISTTAWMRKVAAYKWSAVLFSLVLTVTLAPTNSGCMLDYEGRCNNNDSLFAVSIASGQFGFVPVCAASAVAGIVLILSLSYALAAKESRVSLFFTRMGRFSLQILLVNADCSCAIDSCNSAGRNAADYCSINVSLNPWRQKIWGIANWTPPTSKCQAVSKFWLMIQARGGRWRKGL
jgi:fucose 4-O-acetylase-like acetyltransferase